MAPHEGVMNTLSAEDPRSSYHSLIYGPEYPCTHFSCNTCYPDKARKPTNYTYWEDEPCPAADSLTYSTLYKAMIGMNAAAKPATKAFDAFAAAMMGDTYEPAVVTEEAFRASRRSVLEAALEVVVAEAVGSPEKSYQALLEATREFVVTAHDYEEGKNA